MDTIVLKSPKPFSISSIQGLLSKDWTVDLSDGETITVDGMSSRVYLHPHPPTGDKKHQLWLDYSDVEMVKKVIEKIANDARILVDNDFGTVLPGDEFVARLRTAPEWNWRH